MYSSYKVDSYNVSVLLSSHGHYLPKNMLVTTVSPHGSHWEPQHPSEQLCVGHITESQNPKVLNVHHHAGHNHRQSGGDEGGMARLQDTWSAALKHKLQQVPNALSLVHLQQPAPQDTYPFPEATSPISPLLHPHALLRL